jgi:hypothetical protein
MFLTESHRESNFCANPYRAYVPVESHAGVEDLAQRVLDPGRRDLLLVLSIRTEEESDEAAQRARDESDEASDAPAESATTRRNHAR